ncbi:MAG: peptidoglycan-binding protein [Alphaproteobacteria bacterium]
MTRGRIWFLALAVASAPAPTLAETHILPAEVDVATPQPVQPIQPVEPATPAPPTLAELQAWEWSWSRDERRQVQRALELLGLYSSGIDGVFGRWSRTGIQAFQQQRADAPTGYLTPDQRITLAVDAALEAQRRAEAAAELARAAAAAAGAEVHEYPTGNVYRGDRGRKGHGVYEWTDGHRYEGAWNNTRHGYGVLILANGWRYAGQWRESIFVGYGVAEGPDGARQLGEWNVPQGTQFSAGLNGYGQVLGADGAVSRGLFAGSVLAAAGQ